MPRQGQNPSLARDLLALGDIYLTLGWLAIQRLRYGPLWPWDARPRGRKAVVTLLRPIETDEDESAVTASQRR